MNITNKQSGFSIIEGVIAVVVIAVLGFIGWTAYNAYTNKPAKVTSTTTSPTNSSTQPVTTTNQPAQPADFVIKEWGVKFQPASGLSSLVYAMQNSNSNAIFTTQDLTALSAKCSATTTGYSGLGGIFRISTADDQPPNPQPTSPTFLASIGGYNYFYQASQSTCVTDPTNTAAQTLYNNESQELYTSLKSLQAAQ